jgi:hypothetical protein
MPINTPRCEFGILLGDNGQCKRTAQYMSKTGNIFLCPDHILSHSDLYVPLGVTVEMPVSRLKLIKKNIKPPVLSKNRMLVAKG